MRAVRWMILGVFAIAIAWTLLLQRETTANLSGEIALLRDDQRQLATLRAERERLVAAQPTAAERERLRADRNALNQLRAEIDQLQERAARMEAAATAAPKKEAPKVAIEVAADGSFSQEGNALQADALKQQLSGLPKGSRVEIRFVLDARASADVARAAVDRLVALEKELGLNLKLSFDTKPLASQ